MYPPGTRVVDKHGIRGVVIRNAPGLTRVLWEWASDRANTWEDTQDIREA
jgi:hypothetical protein